MIKIRDSSLDKSRPFLLLFYFAFHLQKLNIPVFDPVELNTNFVLMAIFESLDIVDYDQATENLTCVLDSLQSFFGTFGAEFVPT